MIQTGGEYAVMPDSVQSGYENITLIFKKKCNGDIASGAPDGQGSSTFRVMAGCPDPFIGDGKT
ncbi:hypothetical protein [Komagataeibacter intermedius]|uniref:hypothetical protein n=1 Tax=Komagataeibacter intermedius TaxID=66229 RepID=UPI000AC9D93C|nr:hypothetical protein [Komagataeibacter intermedius]